MTRKRYQYAANPADLLDFAPSRTTETTYRERVRLSREYVNLVLRPARFVAAMRMLSGATIVGGGAYVVAEFMRQPQPWRTIAGMTIVGVGLGAVLAVDAFWRLHVQYSDVPATIEETSREHETEPPTIERRELNVKRNGETVARVQVSPRILGAVVFSAQQINDMTDRANKDAMLTRDTGGWSGSTFDDVREELAAFDFIETDEQGQYIKGQASRWTAAGLDWLRGVED